MQAQAVEGADGRPQKRQHDEIRSELRVQEAGNVFTIFAFRDRLGDPEKDHGSYHALDIYSIIATTTETEWREAVSLRDECQTHPFVIEAGAIVAEYFAEPTSMGMIRLRESPYFRDQFPLHDFASTLGELFPASLASVQRAECGGESHSTSGRR